MPNGRITVKMVFERVDDLQKEISDLRVGVARIEGKMSKNSNGTKDFIIRWLIRGGLAFVVGKEAINVLPK